MKGKGVLTVVSGFSGTGKGTVTKALARDYSQYVLSVSATTRKPRNDEREGVEYYFMDNAAFEKMIAEDAFYEYAGYVDHYYGTPKAFVDEQLAAGKDVILEIELQGALKIKKQIPDCLMIFLIPPSAKELERRLSGRGTEEKEVIQARLRRAVEEADGAEAYDYIVVNDDLEMCISCVHQLIQDAHCRAAGRLKLVQDIKNDLIEMVKGE